MGFFDEVSNAVTRPQRWTNDLLYYLTRIKEFDKMSDSLSSKSLPEGSSSTEKASFMVDRVVDPSGLIDYGTRNYLGQIVPDEVKPYASTVGGLIGNIWGPGGAAAGAGIGSKISGDSYSQGFKTAGMAAGASYLNGIFKGLGTAASGAASGEGSGGGDLSSLSGLGGGEGGDFNYKAAIEKITRDIKKQIDEQIKKQEEENEKRVMLNKLKLEQKASL